MACEEVQGIVGEDGYVVDCGLRFSRWRAAKREGECDWGELGVVGDEEVVCVDEVERFAALEDL